MQKQIEVTKIQNLFHFLKTTEATVVIAKKVSGYQDEIEFDAKQAGFKTEEYGNHGYKFTKI